MHIFCSEMDLFCVGKDIIIKSIGYIFENSSQIFAHTHRALARLLGELFAGIKAAHAYCLSSWAEMLSETV